MDKKRIEELAQDERFISGIYNYCDRWCDRCPQTARCLNFAMGQEEFADPDSQDVRNEAFWKRLEGMFQVTLEMLREKAAELGLDLDALDIEEAAEQKRLLSETAGYHPLCRAARAYGELAEKWFDGAEVLFGSEEEAGAGPGPFGPQREPHERSDLEEALEVVRWYQHQIYVKVVRAMQGLLEEDTDATDDTVQYARDSDGSAKVALIGIERSIAAWGTIRNQFPYYDRDILSVLAHLEMLRKKVEDTFPHARAFLRPGFDEIRMNG
jgi:hypothetical protein